MIIARRFRGPPESANGGYACGAVASILGGGAVEATLRKPPPIDRELVGEFVDGRAVLRDGEVIVAEAVPTTVELDAPAPVSFEDAERAARGFPSMTNHMFPMCFVCGPDRDDGLRIFPGAVEGREVAAAPWIPDASLAGPDGQLPAEIVWAALDCPSWFGMHCFEPFDGVALLGRLTARIVEPPRIGERCVAAGWFEGRSGRKMATASAIYGDDGGVRAVARATWIALK